MKNNFLPSNPFFLLSFFCITLLIFSCSSPGNDIKTHLENARKYFAAKEFKKAKIEFQNVIQLDPKNDAAQSGLGETYVHLQDPVKAAAAFYKAVTINPDNFKAQLRLGQILLLAKKTKQARDTVDKMLRRYPGKVEVLQLLAGIQIQERNLPIAIKTLKKAITMAPSNSKTYLFLAHLLFTMNRLDEAEPYYLKTIELDKTLRAPYIELARLYGRKGEIKKIMPLINKWVKVPGDQIQKNNDLARFQESLGHFKQAERTYLQMSINAPENFGILVDLGSFYARHNKNDKALKIFLRALDIDKNNVNVQTAIATIYFEQKKYIKAESALDAILSNNKKNVQANFLKGRLYFNRKDFVSALKCFEIVTKEAPDNAMVRYLKARCLLHKGISDTTGQELSRVAAGYATIGAWVRNLAEHELLKALKIDPGFINARLLLIDILLRDKNIESASHHIAVILKKDPRNLKALILKGKLKFQEKDLPGAEKIYRSIIERHTGFAPGYVALGLTLNGMKKTDQALKAFDKALEINPRQMDALNYKVSIYMQEKNLTKALDACREHRQKFKSTAPSLAIIDLIQGRIFMTTGKIETAQGFFKKAIEQLPTLASAYEELAMACEYQKDIPGAMENYEKLLKLKPDYLPTYLRLSHIYKNRGDLKKAKKYLRDALLIKKDFAPAANNLAFILSQGKGSLYEALRLAKIARDKDPENPEYLDTLGWIYYLQGSNDLALKELENSINIDPNNAVIQYHLGWAYYKAHKFKEARKHMAKALALDPEFKGADKAKDILGE